MKCATVRDALHHQNRTLQNAPNRRIIATIGAGLRVSEVGRLRVSDIDSKRMQLFIRSGKREKDRYAILSQANLELLREYWKAYRPIDWLFYHRYYKDRHLGTRGIQQVLVRALEHTNIQKHVTMHTLRHSFATHLLEDGVNLFHIKQLLGHAKVNTTCRYLRMLSGAQAGVQNPLDRIAGHEYFPAVWEGVPEKPQPAHLCSQNHVRH